MGIITAYLLSPWNQGQIKLIFIFNLLQSPLLPLMVILGNLCVSLVTF